MARLKYHFEPKKGWINDPNGMIFFKGKYHAFFQYNPHSVQCVNMHWGHAVSDDLINWEELPPAIVPDNKYETVGCWSGGAVVRDDVLYLYYTSNSKEFGQTVSLVTSEDGMNFFKYEKNPIIETYHQEGSADFRDPNVSLIDGKYYLVIGTGKDGTGKTLLYTSADLINWEYSSVLFEDENLVRIVECPDFFKLGDKYVLMFSRIDKEKDGVAFIVGDFDGKKLVNYTVSIPEIGPYFYAPQSFCDDKGRRIVIAWMSRWSKKIAENETYAGALSIPRELFFKDGQICMYPVSEACHLLEDSDSLVNVSENEVAVENKNGEELKYSAGKISDIKILRDENAIEVFINGGKASFTYVD